MKQISTILSFSALLLAACGTNPQAAKNDGATNGAISGPHIQMATEPIVPGYKQAGSWCDAHFPEAPPITGDPVNANLRRVGIGPGIYKAAVNYGTMASSFMLRVNANGVLDLYTSKHFPLCLSQDSNFKINPDGLSFEYNNNHHIRYTVELEQNAGGYSMAFKYTPADNFGFSVRKCEDCK
jgi:hypothetical protein